MFTIFNKKPQGEKITFKIDGMHCTSCSMNIDGELEDTEGILEAKTSYAKSVTTVMFDPGKIDVAGIKKVIEGVGYGVSEM